MQGCGCIERPAFPAPSDLREANELAKLGRNRAAGSRSLVQVAWYDDYWGKERPVGRGSTSEAACDKASIRLGLQSHAVRAVDNAEKRPICHADESP